MASDIRRDVRLISRALLKLNLPRLIAQGIVLAIAAAVWLFIALLLYRFGETHPFDSLLQPMGPQVTSMLNRAIPFLWWALIAIWTLIAFLILRSWLVDSLAAGRRHTVPVTVLSALRPQLSAETLDVVNWVWPRKEPLTTGDLQRARRELRANRVGKLALLREQAAILDKVDKE